MTNPFERVYVKYVGDGIGGPSLRVKVTRLSDGDWDYDLPGKFHHICESRDCQDVDRMALLFLED